jgi:acyl carrier protein
MVSETIKEKTSLVKEIVNLVIGIKPELEEDLSNDLDSFLIGILIASLEDEFTAEIDRGKWDTHFETTPITISNIVGFIETFTD